ncbi:DUF4330 domain-containing protein [Patescibacteria group bacterium]|nr:DUF4330 domain-containing protein [Patescibacteria group bacterium]
MTSLPPFFRSVIDRKGKLFGKIHIFDALVIITILLFLVVIAKQLFRQKTWVTAEIKVSPEQWWYDNYPPPRWLAQSIQKGDREVDWSGATTAEVLETKSYDTGYDRVITYLKIRFLSSYDSKSHQYLYNGKPLAVGGTLTLNLSHTTVQGLLIDVEGLPDMREKVTKIVTLKLYDRYPWFADAIHVGDAFKVNGVPIAEVVAKDVRPAEKTTVKIDSQSGGTLSIANQDPLKMDITLKMKMQLIKEKDGGLIFRDDQRIIIGNDLFIALPNVNLQYATVIDVE